MEIRKERGKKRKKNSEKMKKRYNMKKDTRIYEIMESEEGKPERTRRN